MFVKTFTCLNVWHVLANIAFVPWLMTVIRIFEISTLDYMEINYLYAWVASGLVNALKENWKVCPFTLLQIASQWLENDNYECGFWNQCRDYIRIGFLYTCFRPGGGKAFLACEKHIFENAPIILSPSTIRASAWSSKYRLFSSILICKK